ncbi:MAG: hypothetical protein JWN60_1583 [Acidobacteria bacterium]|jgi:hypothetical protein|nr:hypothetical protein [Acidobacteriota bacterium]
METTVEIREQISEEWIPLIYRERVRTQRTRSYHINVPKKENHAEILHTLLGIELKVGNYRFTCPDLSTARYLQVFARIGCQDVAIPYDITKISTLADELEVSWHKTLLLFEEKTFDKTPSARGRMRANLIKDLRQEIEEIGAGALMPEFRQSTKQRE